MIEYIVCGIVAVLGIGALIAISVAKAKIGWSFVKEDEDNV